MHLSTKAAEPLLAPVTRESQLPVLLMYKQARKIPPGLLKVMTKSELWESDSLPWSGMQKLATETQSFSYHGPGFNPY